MLKSGTTSDSESEFELRESDQHLGDESFDLQSNDLNDVDLLRECSREDLFMLIKEDPEYYCKLIRDNALCDELSIKIYRSRDGGGLNIKFRIYPEDRWMEVGYWGDAPDREVYQDFKTQIDALLSRNQSGKRTESRHHLESQLDANNDMRSPDYGQDISKNNQKFKMNDNLCFKTPLEKQLERIVEESRDVGDHLRKCRHPPENLKENIRSQDEQIRDNPIDFLNQFVAGLIDQIIKEIPRLIEIDPSQDYRQIASVLEKEFVDIPNVHQEAHLTLIQNLKSCAYLQKINYLLDWDSYPEIHDYLIDFHREAMKINPGIYRKIKKDVLFGLLDDDDQKILKDYCLDVQDVWLNYLNNQD